ncbi:condensation domain-containing protein [Rhodohalobacter sulfatireducens]|uniref:Condensation domain-containing protein n=1 Tax=Rhodohalobacter sulfatireducens TaxID=2911366 RepID=A0ABS9KIX6_9BACT|nr:condensation domain-containing protein [Rhodohalobacter sulfatireducens]MCG2590814.1 condensation domain-containing protein [Rhodohalobacter sulfatireducens]
MPKAKVQNVFPLTYNQKILLFHHLSATDDNGIIQVRCTIEGTIDPSVFGKAWDAVVKKHDVLRTSIQWKNLSKELQVVQQDATLEINWIDLKNDPQPDESAKRYRLNDSRKPLPLYEAPVSRVIVLKQNDHKYQLLWTCHHILLDGWSSRLILEDVFRYYDQLMNGQDLDYALSEPTIVDYYKALEKDSTQNEAKQFWKDLIDGQQFPNRISNINLDHQGEQNFQSHEVCIPGKELQKFVKENHITLTSLLQTAWLLTLQWFHQNNRVAIGTVVSGRAYDFPGIENIAGLLSNVLPVIHHFQPDQSFAEAAKQVQKHHAKARNFENINIDQIKEWYNWEGNPNIFDTLLVVENFVLNEIECKHLHVRNFESGLTTTYPITIAVVPGETIKLYCVWNENKVEGDVAKKLLFTFHKLLQEYKEKSIDQLSTLLGEPPTVYRKEDTQQETARNFESATTTTELELAKIWERVLGIHPIGIKDNFFALGGSSIQALQLFREIEQNIHKTLLPSVLINHPTIHQLSKLISDDAEVEFSSIVPLKISGEKPPLFCIHAGGAHVFLYKELAESFGKDYPVYAIQPKGLDGGEIHNSIEEMAQDYLKEILAITGKQKFYVLGYCFSKVICLEIARIAKEQDLKVELVIVDSADLPMIQMHRLIGKKRDRIFIIGKQIISTGKKILYVGWQGIKRSFQKINDRLNAKLGGKANIFLKGEGMKAESDTDYHLERIILNFTKLNNQYHWDPVHTKVHLIRSSDYENRQNKNFHIDLWETLSKNELSTYQVSGRHKTIFEGNSAVEMAQIIEKIINDEAE